MTEGPIDNDNSTDDDDVQSGLDGVNNAYRDLVEGLRGQALSSAELTRLSTNFSKATGLDQVTDFLGNADSMRSIGIASMGQFPAASIDPIPLTELGDIPYDSSPSETARNTERMAEILENQHAAVTELVTLTASSLALTTEQREAAQRAERFSRRTTIASVVIAAASLGTSIAALLVAIVLT